MSFRTWLKERKKLNLRLHLAEIDAKLKTWEPYLRDKDGTYIGVVENVANLRSRKAIIEEQLKS